MSDERPILTREEFEALPREERRRLILRAQQAARGAVSGDAHSVSARDAALRATTADRTKTRRRLANRRARRSRRANR